MNKKHNCPRITCKDYERCRGNCTHKIDYEGRSPANFLSFKPGYWDINLGDPMFIETKQQLQMELDKRDARSVMLEAGGIHGLKRRRK